MCAGSWRVFASRCRNGAKCRLRVIAPSLCAYAGTSGNSVRLPETSDLASLLARRRVVEAGALGRRGCCSGCRRFTPVYRNPINLPKLAITRFGGRAGGLGVGGARPWSGEPTGRGFSRRAGLSTRRCRAAFRDGRRHRVAARMAEPRRAAPAPTMGPNVVCLRNQLPNSQQLTRANRRSRGNFGVAGFGRMAGPARAPEHGGPRCATGASVRSQVREKGVRRVVRAFAETPKSRSDPGQSHFASASRPVPPSPPRRAC